MLISLSYSDTDWNCDGALWGRTSDRRGSVYWGIFGEVKIQWRTICAEEDKDHLSKSFLHYSDVTWAPWRLILLPLRLFGQHFRQANTKDKIEFHITGLVRADRIPPQRANYAENRSRHRHFHKLSGLLISPIHFISSFSIRRSIACLQGYIFTSSIKRGAQFLIHSQLQQCWRLSSGLNQ